MRVLANVAPVPHPLAPTTPTPKGAVMPLTITIPNPLDPTAEPVTVQAWTVRELATDVAMHPETVRRYAADELWPHTRWGRRLVFTEQQRRAILASFVEAHDYPAHTHGHH